MKKTLLAVGVLAAVNLTGCGEEKPVALDTEAAKVGYAIGYTTGSRMKAELTDVDIEALIGGIREAYQEADARMTEEEMGQAITGYQQRKMEEARQLAQKEAEDNLKAGQDFLAENAKKEGVVTLDSGLQYKVLKSGNGKSPGPEDIVEVHYHGTLIDGTVFDSSMDRGTPVSFPVNRVIPGWTEALQLMKEGDEWELYIPSELAYGAQGARGVIGPNATLVFKVELLAVNPEEEQKEEAVEATDAG